MITFTVNEILDILQNEANPPKAVIHQQYHKSDLKFYGWTTPEMRKLAGKIAGTLTDRERFFELSEQLWRQPVFEARMMVNFIWAKRLKYFQEEDFPRFYEHFKQCDGWAVTDLLAIPVFGEFLRTFPDCHSEVDTWKTDVHLWVRRAGILRFITPVRHKEAWPLLMEGILIHHFPENDFFIRKAIGWTLREWSKIEPQRVRRFAERHKKSMAPLSYREAVRLIKNSESDN